ncbi:MAG TPA: tripartite tricarboxylate transporter permease, partial [Candidatus Thermoplasmatota archaeon]|nr:tripartite tricarboxylate transporter permease [Candidatus Thermoplasmatota archaeon]
ATALPGAHVNLLALLATGAGAPFLVGALAGAPFGLALSGTLLGVGEDDALPAHRLAREGRAAEAVALQAWGAFAGLALALALAGLLSPLARPVGEAALRAMAWLLLGVCALLVLTEPARPRVHPALVAAPWGPLRVPARRVEDPHGVYAGQDWARAERVWRAGPLSRVAGAGLALLVLLLSGALGLVALRMGARSPLGLPASVLLPLLAGLFAAPVLLDALRAGAAPRARLRAPRPPRGWLRAVAPAALASGLLGLAPGVSASHVALLAPRRRDPEARLVAAGAVNGGAVAFTLLAWVALGKARAGALVVIRQVPPPWLDLAAVALLAAGAACLLARGLTRPLAEALSRLPPRLPPLAGLLMLIVAVALTTGAWGLAVLGAAAAVGTLAARLGVRRGLCMGALLVPSLLRAWALL